MVTCRALLGAAVVLALAACQSTQSMDSRGESVDAFPEAAYERALAEGKRVYDLDPTASTLRAYAYRAGPMARQGHNHVIQATGWRGALALDADKPAASRLDLRIPVASLVVDAPEVRDELGGAFGTALDADARAGTRDNMVSPGLLDGANHPAIGVTLVSVTGELPRPILTLAVTVRGRTAEVEVPVAVQQSEARVRARGRLVLRHKALGLEPFSAAGGALRVAEPVTIEFDLVGQRRRADAAPY